MRKIIRNIIQCKHCKDIIESKSTYDFVTCSCGCCTVDGGHDYLRRLFKNDYEEDILDLSETIEVEEDLEED